MRFAVSDGRGINMIPILYEKTETQFTNNGIGLLSDCIYCNVTEERNGIYECEFQYPQTGIHFDDITEGRIIACTHDEAGDLQAFDIYKSSKVIDGIVTFYARHISYRQNEIAVKPFTSQSCAGAIQALKTNSINTNPFSYWTDKAVDGEYKVEAIRGLRGLLGGEQGSLLDRYGTGEYEWDNFTTKLHLHRGKDTDVEIRYGKNLMDLTDESDFSDTYNGVAPYWIGTQMSEDGGEQEEISVTLPEWAIYSQNTTYGSRDIVVPLDLSGSFQEPPTAEQLRAKAESYLSDSILPNRNLKVDFIQLWQTEEYAAYAPLERCKLCDTVTVIHTALNISTRQKIIRVVWDVLMDRYAEMELGDTKSTYSSLVRELVDPDLEEIEQLLKAVTQVADNTNQYFWHTEVESSVGANDTGAHITEITREEFMDDPANGGPNLLMRSNGIALRDGVTELARFKANGIQIGQDTEANVELLSDSLTFYGDDLEKALEASSDGVTAYISGVMAASFKTTGIEFNDELPMTIGNSTTFIKWVKENNTWKLKIQADEVEIGGVPALTTQDQLTITNIEYAYQLSSSGTTVPTGTWSSTPVAPTTTQYAWTRTTVTYSDGHQAISYSVGGKAGTNGSGVTISSTSVKYATSSSGTTAPSSGWQTSVPSVSQGYYLWTRTIVTYSDGSSTTSYSVARQGENGTDITSQYLQFNNSGTYAGLNVRYTSSYKNFLNLSANGVKIYDGTPTERVRINTTGMYFYNTSGNATLSLEGSNVLIGDASSCNIYASSTALSVKYGSNSHISISPVTMSSTRRGGKIQMYNGFSEIQGTLSSDTGGADMMLSTMNSSDMTKGAIIWLDSYASDNSIKFDCATVYTGGPVYNPSLFAPYKDNMCDLGQTSYRWKKVYAASNAISTSDRKEKDITGEINFAKSLIMAINPVEYMWKNSDHKRTHMGFVAQDVAEVSKALGKDLSLYEANYISENPSVEYHGEQTDDKNLRWGLAYEELIAPMVKVIQEHEEEITRIKQRMEGIA